MASGNILKRGQQKYLVRIPLGTDSTGKRRTLTKTIHGTKADAEKFIREKLRERDLGTLPVQATECFGPYATQWLTLHRPHLVRQTQKHYTYMQSISACVIVRPPQCHGLARPQARHQESDKKGTVMRPCFGNGQKTLPFGRGQHIKMWSFLMRQMHVLQRILIENLIPHGPLQNLTEDHARVLSTSQSPLFTEIKEKLFKTAGCQGGEAF